MGQSSDNSTLINQVEDLAIKFTTDLPLPRGKHSALALAKKNKRIAVTLLKIARDTVKVTRGMIDTNKNVLFNTLSKNNSTFNYRLHCKMKSSNARK